jgi:hypothetical protein
MKEIRVAFNAAAHNNNNNNNVMRRKRGDFVRDFQILTHKKL